MFLNCEIGNALIKCHRNIFRPQEELAGLRAASLSSPGMCIPLCSVLCALCANHLNFSPNKTKRRSFFLTCNLWEGMRWIGTIHVRTK